MQSFEPGEDWFWDFEQNQVVDGPELAAPREHPSTQPTPGAAGAVPADWTQRLN